jgi:hypothetical protein
MNAKRDFDTLAGRIETVSSFLKEDARSVINRSVTARAWLTGYYIVEYEQHGQDRAKYGEGLLKALSKRLGKADCSVPRLKKFRQFYQSYPDWKHPVADYLSNRMQKGYSPIIQLPIPAGRIGESPIIQSKDSFDIVVHDGDNISISPWALFKRLSYTHILQFMG